MLKRTIFPFFYSLYFFHFWVGFFPVFHSSFLLFVCSILCQFSLFNIFKKKKRLSHVFIVSNLSEINKNAAQNRNPIGSILKLSSVLRLYSPGKKHSKSYRKPNLIFQCRHHWGTRRVSVNEPKPLRYPNKKLFYQVKNAVRVTRSQTSFYVIYNERVSEKSSNIPEHFYLFFFTYFSPLLIWVGVGEHFWLNLSLRAWLLKGKKRNAALGRNEVTYKGKRSEGTRYEMEVFGRNWN